MTDKPTVSAVKHAVAIARALANDQDLSLSEEIKETPGGRLYEAFEQRMMRLMDSEGLGGGSLYRAVERMLRVNASRVFSDWRKTKDGYEQRFSLLTKDDLSDMRCLLEAEGVDYTIKANTLHVDELAFKTLNAAARAWDEHDLIANYQWVAMTLRERAQYGGAEASACLEAAEFIDARLADAALRTDLDEVAQNNKEALNAANRIKAAGKMSFSTAASDDALRVSVFIAGDVPSGDAKKMFEVSKSIYGVLFGDEMQDITTDERGVPRTMSFTCTGALKALFEGWQLNKQPNILGR